jgi:hypothetical protein
MRVRIAGEGKSTALYSRHRVNLARAARHFSERVECRVAVNIEAPLRSARKACLQSPARLTAAYSTSGTSAQERDIGVAAAHQCIDACWAG